MQNSPLQLEEYLLRALEFALTDDLKDRPDRSIRFDSLNIDVNANVDKRENNPRKWRCELTIESKSEEGGNYPYRFSVTYVGFYSVVEDYPAERVEMMVKANAPALLYSAARETLLHLTGRGRHPAILLPSVTFIEPPKAAEPPAAQKGGSKQPPRKAVPRKASKK